MKTLFLSALGALSALALAGPASAQADGDYYTFDLVNQTNVTILTFQTARMGNTPSVPDSAFSADWMPTRVLSAGDTVAMRFFDSDDACVYVVKVTFEGGGEFKSPLDFCNLEYVVVTNDGISGTNGD